MKIAFKAAMLAAASLVAVSALPSVASAQAAGSVAVANLDQAVERSNAYVLAVNQIKTTYKPQIDAFDARSKVLNAEIQPLATAFDAARRAPNPNQAALQTQLTQLQTKQQSSQAELQKLYLPIGRAQAYAEEQIVTKLDTALKAAMNKKKVALVLAPQATVSYQPSVDLTNDIIAELNTAVTQVGIVPPQGWQPGGQQGQGPAAPATAQPPKPQPQGR
jgi:Skp family chaperone for outer membrane proteins